MPSTALKDYDRNAQERIHTATEALTKRLVSRERIVFPNLQECLIEDVKLRSLLAKFLASIRALCIHIQTSANGIKKSEGSRASTKIAKETISKALTAVKQCTEDIARMDYSAVQMLTNRMQQLNTNINAEVSNFETQKAQIMMQIEQRNQEQKDQNLKLQTIQDSLHNLCTQIINTEKCIKDRHREIQESKTTVEQLVTLNIEDEQAINSILATSQETGNNATHYGISFSSRNTSGKVLNHYQAGEIRDLRTKISERMVQIDKHNNHQTTMSESLHTLNCELRNHNSTYQMTLEELSRSQKSYLSKIESIQNEIFQLHQRFLSVHERAVTLDGIIKRRTTSFTAYLAEVETLKECFSHGTSPYSQLKSAMSVLMESVESSVTLLTSTELQDMSDARQHLLKQATFLSNYWEAAKTVMQPTAN